jgi:hypothetical protein
MAQRRRRATRNLLGKLTVHDRRVQVLVLSNPHASSWSRVLTSGAEALQKYIYMVYSKTKRIRNTQLRRFKQEITAT